MAGVACPKCAAAADMAAGGSVTCAGCGTDFWNAGGAAEAFTGVLNDRAGVLGTAWSVVAATGVLAAFLGILGAEVWAVVWLIAQARS